jgi:hypothetical protein
MPEGSSDQLVDEFVRYLNATGFEPRFGDEVPEDLRIESAGDGMFAWQIQPASSTPWLDELDRRLSQKWPKSYRSLVRRYSFCNFEVGPVMFYANSGQELSYELSNKVTKDKHLFATLNERGYLPFGQPNETNYDPVCFDMQRRSRQDAPIVQLDHEEILIRTRIQVVHEIAPSLAMFMRQVIAERFAVS